MPSEMILKRTPLHAKHKELGARLVPFAGFDMPVQYTGLIDEHTTVRTAVGLFDVSHMGIAIIKGERTREFLDFALTRDFAAITPGVALYSLLCRPGGGTVDDLIVYCESAISFYLVLNASNKQKDLEYLVALNDEHKFGCEFVSLFETHSLLALQGPKAQALLKKLGSDFDLSQTFRFTDAELTDQKIKVKLASTGYTGEAGCEIFVANPFAEALWEQIMKAGLSFGIKAIGLGARDTLRTEMGYSLYGHELGEDINPIEAGLKWAVGLNKNFFVGKESLVAAATNPQRKLVGLKVNSKQAPRPEMRVVDANDRDVGLVTSGTFAPTLGYSIGLALVDAASIPPYRVNIRGQLVPFEISKRPFYRPISQKI